MLYFAYGSNMFPARIEGRLGQCRSILSAWVEGYALRFHKNGGDGSGKCDCFETRLEGHVIYGVVYELTHAQAERLDAIEGPGYARRQMRVRHATGHLEVYAYLARREHINGQLSPFCWYKGLVLAGAMRAGLPGEYVDEIRAVVAVADPDHQRRTHNESLFKGGVAV